MENIIRSFIYGQENHREIHKNALELLYETVGKKWDNQGLILAKPKRSKIKHDIGFNHAVGAKWPTKAWPMDSWKKLLIPTGNKMLPQVPFTVSLHSS